MNPGCSTRRVLHVVGGLRRAGVETWLVQILRHIPRSALQFDFLVHSPEPYDYCDEVEASGSRILVCCRHSNALTYSLNFMRLLKEHGPYDAVHSHVHHFGGLILFLAARTGIPVRIAHSHLGSLLQDRRATWTRRTYFAVMKSLISRYATAGFAVSTSAADTLFMENWRYDERWVITPLGIDLTPFTSPVDKAEVRRELGIPSAAFVVGHVGRFEDQKNHEFFVEVALFCARLMPQLHFLLVGDGPLRSNIEAKVAALGLSSRFTFAGVRTDVPRVMKGAMDVFLFPSKYEGLGLVVVEAQAAGLRSLVSEAVPAEADVLPGYVMRKSLNVPAKAWAHELCALSSAGAPGMPPQHLFKSHSIEESAALLMRLYDRQFRAHVQKGSAAKIS